MIFGQDFPGTVPDSTSDNNSSAIFGDMVKRDNLVPRWKEKCACPAQAIWTDNDPTYYDIQRCKR